MENNSLTFRKDIEIKLDICIGYLYYDNINGCPAKIVANNLRMVRFYTIPEEYLHGELDKRKEHFIGVLDKFKSKMNNLDNEINLTYSFSPVNYKAKKLVCNVKSSGIRIGNEKNHTVEEDLAEIRKVYPNAVLDRVEKSGMALYHYYYIGEDVDAVGGSYTVSFDRPGFKLDGYNFIGYVSPYTVADEADVDALASEVNLVSPYDENEELTRYLFQTSGKRKCDGCNRESNRSVYFIFMDADEKIHYYGRTCAEKIFGISIVEKLSRFIKGLEIIGQGDIQSSLRRGGNYTARELLSFLYVLSKRNLLYSKEKIDTKGVCYDADNLYSILKHREDLIEGGEVEYSDDEKYIEYLREKQYYRDNSFVDFIAKKDELNKLLDIFYEKGGEYFRNEFVAGDNEFRQKVKAFGIATAEESNMTLIKSNRGIIPYMLRFFFTAQKANAKGSVGVNPDNSQVKTHQVESFTGFKEFAVTIIKADKSMTKKNTPYMKYYAATEDGGGLMWFDFSGKEPMKIGDKVVIGGVISNYNPRGGEFTALDQVIVKNGGEENSSTVNYEQGTRLKDVEMVLVYYNKGYGNGFMKDKNGVQFKFYGDRFGIEFEPGMVLKVTGTVTDYGGKLALNRCKIEDTGKRVNLSESVMKLTEADLNYIIQESIKRLLK